MNIKHLFPLLAGSMLLLAACSEENAIAPVTPPDDGDNTEATNRRDVVIDFKNTLRLKPVEKNGTKAAGDPIATDEENYLKSLDVYVFGSKDENGPYTFQELHYYRDDASEVSLPNVNSYSFNLTAGDQSNTTTALLKLNKGLFVKLYCVANRTTLYSTEADGTAKEFAGFTSLEQTAPGQPNNLVTDGAPKEEDFKKLHTKLIDPTATDPTIDDVLVSPLPMSGAYTTPLDLTDFGTSARTQISFKLTRMVARFDIQNDASKSKFTVEKVSMGNGQNAARFFPIETLVTDPMKLISYPERLVAPETQQTVDEATGATDLTKGAFYTYPSPKDDHGFLVLKGKYAVNQTESKEVSYRIPFQQMVNGVGTYIEVSQNHRYTIAITKADDYHLDFTMNVVDWDDTESKVDPYEPENDFDKKAPVVLKAAETQDAYVLDNGQISVLPVDGSKLAFEMASNTELAHELVFKAGSAKWIKQTAPTKAASMTTTFAYAVDKDQLAAGGKLLPVVIRLTNPASGMRKEITLIATPSPTVTFTPEVGNYSTFDPATLTATIYNVAGQTIKLHVAAETRKDADGNPVTGSTATIDASGSWLTASVAELATAEGDYTFTLGTAQSGASLPSTVVDIASKASKAKSTVTVKLKSPDMVELTESSFNLGTRDGNALNMTGGTGSIPQVSLVGILNNSFTLTVLSPEGVTAAAAGGDTWLEVSTSDGAGDVNGLKKTVITGKIKDATGMPDAAKNDGKITITNKLDATKTVDVEVITTIPAGPVVSMQIIDSNLSSYDEGTKTATLYNVANQSITLVTDKPSTVAAGAADTWLTLPSAKATEHVILINAAQSSTSTTATLTFTNDDGGKTEVTVALADPAITPLASSDFASTTGTNTFEDASSTGGNAKVTMADPTDTNAFTLTVKSKGGIDIDAAQTSSWLTVNKTDETENAGVYTATLTVAIAAGTNLTAAISDGKIVLTNGIAGADGLTIDVVTTVTAVP